MENTLIALIGMIIFTIAVYVGSWLQGTTLTRKFSKWYFIIMLIATVIVTAVTFVLSVGE